MCNLDGMSPQQLVQHGEEAEEFGGYFIVNGNEKLIRQLIMPRRHFVSSYWSTVGTIISISVAVFVGYFGLPAKLQQNASCRKFLL